MGLFNFIRSQFIEVIEWTDYTTDTLVYRFPVEGNEIKMGAKLTVRESQAAVFVNEGRIADVFAPGLYELSTENMPVLTKLKSWKYGFNSPFKAEVYFVNTKQFTNQKWGTANPIMMRDQEFGVLRLRAFGLYSYKVVDPAKFLKELFGTNSSFQTSDIAGQLKGMIISGLSDLLGESRIAALDLAMHYDELGEQIRTKMSPRFSEYGFDMSSFVIENISLPEEVEKVLDKRTSMGILGDMNKFTQYQAAEAIREAARNEGGGSAGTGVGLGAGMGMGQMMAAAFSQGQQSQQPAQPSAFTHGQQAGASCPKCHAPVPAGFKFCGNCGSNIAQEKRCSKCGHEMSGDTNFCPKCGTKLE